MVFSSFPFLIRFLPVVLILYFAAPRSFRNAVLFLISLFFYAWGEPVYVVLMLFSTVVDYGHGWLVEHYKGKGQDKKARLAVISSVCMNLLLLGFFKYSDFLAENINALLKTDIPLHNLPLPVGISFYTFQTMSYTLDVYRGDAKMQKNIINFGAYVAMFPQLIAGPIVRYQTVADELNERSVSVDDFAEGIRRFLIGLGKKVLLANNIGMLWDTVLENGISELTVLGSWIGIFAFAFQLYFDFSGYSDMAIGLGRIFGFHFPENFRYPFCSESITDFWRRWHMTLGTWFREYVYIPLGGNRKGKKRQLINIFTVWMLTGIWHGAAWNFLMWGVYFGVLLVTEKFFLMRWLKKLPMWVRRIYTIFLVSVSWVIFALEDMGEIGSYLLAMLGNGKLTDAQSLFWLRNFGILFVILIVGATEYPKKWAIHICSRYERLGAVLELVFLFLIYVLSVIYLTEAAYNPFLYFRF